MSAVETVTFWLAYVIGVGFLRKRNRGEIMGALSTYEVIACMVFIAIVYVIADIGELKIQNERLREHNRKLRKKLR